MPHDQGAHDRLAEPDHVGQQEAAVPLHILVALLDGVDLIIERAVRRGQIVLDLAAELRVEEGGKLGLQQLDV